MPHIKMPESAAGPGLCRPGRAGLCRSRGVAGWRACLMGAVQLVGLQTAEGGSLDGWRWVGGGGLWDPPMRAAVMWGALGKGGK